MIKFGTSGFRGILGDNFTKENVQKIAYAITKIIAEDKPENPEIVVGYDNRFMSYDFAKWMCEILAEKAKLVVFKIPVPTPLISFMSKKAYLGIVITASHNPYYYNGVKIFLHGGKECDNVFAARIEKYANECDIVFKNILSFDSNNQISLTDDISEYCDNLISYVNKDVVKSRNLKILANVMHGNGTDCLNYIFNKLGINNFQLMKTDLDHYFEYKLPAPYLQNLTDQKDRVIKEKFDIGIALDGDSDRFTLISEKGNIYDCNYVVAVLYYYNLEFKNIKGSVARNYALSNLVDFIAKDYGYKSYPAKVGFKNIAPILESTDTFLGAESNGIAFKQNTLSKDGVYASIAIIDALSNINMGFEEVLTMLQSKYNFHSVTREFAYNISDSKKEEIKQTFEKGNYPIIDGYNIEQFDSTEGYLMKYSGGYWSMVRFSGNEPVVRFFAEMPSIEDCNKVFQAFEQILDVHERQ